MKLTSAFTIALLLFSLHLSAQNHLHVINNNGGEIAKLESKNGLPQLVYSNEHGDIAQIGLSVTTNTSNPNDDDLVIRTIKDFGKIKLRVGDGTGTGSVTINPTSNINNAFAGAYVGINNASPSSPLTVSNINGALTGEFRTEGERTFINFTSRLGGAPLSERGYLGVFDVNYPSNMIMGTTSTSPGFIEFRTKNLTRMAIDQNGSVFIGSSTTTGLSSSARLNVCGSIVASGSILGSQMTCTSDVRYKKNIKPISQPLSTIKLLNGVNYHWDLDNYDDKGFTDEKQIGLIAQEVEKVIPELVVTDVNGYKSVDYVSLTAVLVEAIKEQDTKISSMQNTIDRLLKLENQVKSLISDQ